MQVRIGLTVSTGYYNPGSFPSYAALSSLQVANVRLRTITPILAYIDPTGASSFNPNIPITNTGVSAVQDTSSGWTYFPYTLGGNINYSALPDQVSSISNPGITLVSIDYSRYGDSGIGEVSFILTVDIPDQYTSSVSFDILFGGGSYAGSYYPPDVIHQPRIATANGTYQIRLLPLNYFAGTENRFLMTADSSLASYVEIATDGASSSFNGTIGGRLTGTYQNQYYLNPGFTWSIPTSTRYATAPKIRLVVINNGNTIYGQWRTINVLPIPKFNITRCDENNLSLDASDSFSLVGAAPLNFVWQIPNSFGSYADAVNLSSSSQNPIRAVDLQQVISQSSVGSADSDLFLSVSPKLYVTDSRGFGYPSVLLSDGNPGWYFYTKSGGFLYSPPSRIDAFTDPQGVMFSAVKEATGVRVSRFPNGMASREKLALVPNLSSPSLCQHNTQAGEHQECDAAIYLLGKDATANVWKMFVSDDDGESFDYMANTPFDGTYKVIDAPIGHGCTGLIAVKNTAVTFARTSDGVNYDTFANGTKINSVGDLGASAKTLSFHSEFAFGTDYLKVSNGVDWAKGSDDGGDTWDPI